MKSAFRLKTTGGWLARLSLAIFSLIMIVPTVTVAIAKVVTADTTDMGASLMWLCLGCLLCVFMTFILRHHLVTVIMDEQGVRSRFFFVTVCALDWNEITHIHVTDKSLPKEYHSGFVVVSASDILEPADAHYLSYDFRTEIAIPITLQTADFLEKHLSPFALQLTKNDKGWDFGYRSTRRSP